MRKHFLLLQSLTSPNFVIESVIFFFISFSCLSSLWLYMVYVFWSNWISYLYFVFFVFHDANDNKPTVTSAPKLKLQCHNFCRHHHRVTNRNVAFNIIEPISRLSFYIFNKTFSSFYVCVVQRLNAIGKSFNFKWGFHFPIFLISYVISFSGLSFGKEWFWRVAKCDDLMYVCMEGMKALR